MLASERLRILSRQGEQNPEDLANSIFNIGGQRYQFDFSQEPSVASIGEALRASHVETGDVKFFKLRKPSVNPRSLDRDAALVQGLLRVWVPKAQQLQIQGYVRDMALDLHKQADYRNERDQANQFESAYQGQPFGGIHAFYASSEGDVLGMDGAKGVPLSQLSSLPGEEQERAELAYMRAMMHQIGNGTFHADPTRENVFWDAATRRIELIDMGSVVKLGPSARLEMLEYFLVMMSRDPKAVATTLVRSAGRVTSELAPEPLHATLAAQLKDVFSHADWTPQRTATELRHVAESLGVWGKTDQAGLMRASIIVSQNLKDSLAREKARPELLRAMVGNLSQLARQMPREAGRTLANVGAALGRQPAAFAQSAMELVGADQLERLSSLFDDLLSRASFGLVGAA